MSVPSRSKMRASGTRARLTGVAAARLEALARGADERQRLVAVQRVVRPAERRAAERTFELPGQFARILGRAGSGHHSEPARADAPDLALAVECRRQRAEGLTEQRVGRPAGLADEHRERPRLARTLGYARGDPVGRQEPRADLAPRNP